MLPIDSRSPESAEILKALGELALAASQAEAYAAQGLYYLLTDTPGDEEGASRIALEFRSFDSLYRLLGIALRGETPLSDILEVAKSDAQKRDSDGDPMMVAALAEVASSVGNCGYLARYASRNPRATALDYLNKVKALYDKRNECIHALGIEFSEHEANLYKRKKDGRKAVVNAQNLMEPCEECLYDPDISLGRAIDAVSLELAMASLALILLPISVQWFRRRGTAFDFAPLVDHYVALSLQPLDQQLGFLRELEATIQAKLDAYHAANPSATS